MRIAGFLGSIVAVVGAATALAAPAVAQGNIDQIFLDELHKKGVPIGSDADALSLARGTCGVLNNGGSAEDGLAYITKATHWSSQQATDFGILAVMAYCSDKMPQATAPPQEAQATQAPKTGPQLNVPSETAEPPSLVIPPPENHYPYGPRFGPH